MKFCYAMQHKKSNQNIYLYGLIILYTANRITILFQAEDSEHIAATAAHRTTPSSRWTVLRK